jgi:hypothetical protein
MTNKTLKPKPLNFPTDFPNAPPTAREMCAIREPLLLDSAMALMASANDLQAHLDEIDAKLFGPTEVEAGLAPEGCLRETVRVTSERMACLVGHARTISSRLSD